MLRSRLRRPHLGLLFALVWPLAACSGGAGSTPTAPTTPTPVVVTTPGPSTVTYYSGAVATQPVSNAGGAITIRTTATTTLVNGVAQPDPIGLVTALLETVGGTEVTLRGTWMPATNQVTLAGGGYQINAAVYADSSLRGSGTVTGSAGLRALSTTPTAVSMGALPRIPALDGKVPGPGGIGSPDNPVMFCGSYDGNYLDNNAKVQVPEYGGVCLTTTGGRFTGTAASTDETIYFNGQINGSVTNASFNTSGPFDGLRGSVSVNGSYTLLMRRWSGSYGAVDGHGGLSNGTWYADLLVQQAPPPPSVPDEICVCGKGLAGGAGTLPTIGPVAPH